MINPNTKVVPIDHGWANMKTEQDVFTSGVSEITAEPALYNDVLEYNNKYYKIRVMKSVCLHGKQTTGAV